MKNTRNEFPRTTFNITAQQGLIGNTGATGLTGATGPSGIISYYEKVNLTNVNITGFDYINTLSTTVPDGVYLVNFNGGFMSTPSNPIIDVIEARTTLLNLPVSSNPFISGIIPNGAIIVPGVYNMEAVAISTPASSIIKFNGNGLYVIRTTGAMATGASNTFLLTNGALASDIFWLIDGAASLGANNNFSGTIISSAACALGDACIVNGRCICITTGAFTATNTLNSSITHPVNSSFISLKSAISYAILSNRGNITITNSGSFIINGNIGSASGIYAGASVVVNGIIEIPVIPSSIFSVGIYENVSLIPKTLRMIYGHCNILSNGCIISSVGTNTYKIGIDVISGTFYINESVFTMVKIN